MSLYPPASSGGITDGDKGEISVTGGVWTIDAGVVTEAKQVLADNTTQDVSTTQHGYAPKAPNDATKFLNGVGAYAVPGGDTVHVSTPADTEINSVTDVTISTHDVLNVVAGDQVLVDSWFTILNNSTATRVYRITADFDGAFDIELVTGALAFSSSLIHSFRITSICDIRSTSLAYCMSRIEGYTAAGIASGGDPTMLATSLNTIGWGTSASNLTGTLTASLNIRSAAATATQTCRLHHCSVRKLSPI